MKAGMRVLCALLCMLLFLVSCGASAGGQSEGEAASASQGRRAARLVEQMLAEGKAFFSCRIGEEPYLPSSAVRSVTQREDGEARTIVITETREDGLVFETILRLYRAFDALEAVVTVKNGGKGNSPSISDFAMVDMDLPIPGKGQIAIETTRGCLTTGFDDHYDFSSVKEVLGVGGTLSYAPKGGRSADGAWPYFDLACKEGGAVVAIGWTGQWSSSFARIPGGVRFKTGQASFDAYLLPGESVRGVSATVLFYDGSSEDGRNAFRQLYLHHYTLKQVTEEDFIFPISLSAPTLQGGNTVPDKKAIGELIDHYKHHYGQDDLCVWVDAGWYGTGKEWHLEVGNWTPHKDIGEEGMREIAEMTHAAGYRFILWLEPERAYFGTEALKEEGLFTEYSNGSGHLLRLDTDRGYEWMLALLSDAIEEYGVDIYRQDFNLRPLEFWLATDDAGRVGITENHYITNLYRLIDTLSEKYPRLLVDNCASGGRRLDIEMMRRCISLFRTDYPCTPYNTEEGLQSQTQNLLSWIPLTATGFHSGDQNDPYLTYSFGGVGLIVGNGDFGIDVTKALAPFARGNYYSLRVPCIDDTSHQAWELYDPARGEGYFIALAREKTKDGLLSLKLKGLDAHATYRIANADTGQLICIGSGKNLMEEGVSVYLRARSAKCMTITRVVAAEEEVRA